MYRIVILLFVFSASLFAQESELVIKDHETQVQPNQPIETPIDLQEIKEGNNQETTQKELDLDLTQESNNSQNKNQEEQKSQNINNEEINIKEIPSLQKPQAEEMQKNGSDNQDLMEEKIKKEKRQDSDISKEYSTKERRETKDPQEQELEIQEEIKKREKAEKEKEALEAERARIRNMQAEEAKTKEEQEKKAKEKEQKTNPPTPSKPNTPAIQTPNPNANPASPDFFDLNKNQSYEKLRSIGPKELREKIEQCEEKEDKNTCFDVGMIYYQGRSIYGQQLKHAFYFFDRSCDEKKGLGCYEAGIIGANFKQYPYALVFLEKSCQSGDLRGCKNLGILYYNGWGTPKNVNRATELFNFGCKSGDQSSCQKLYLALGDAYKEVRNFIGAKKNYQKGCELGDEQSCREMEIVDSVQKELYRQNVIENNTRRKP